MTSKKERIIERLKLGSYTHQDLAEKENTSIGYVKNILSQLSKITHLKRFYEDEKLKYTLQGVVDVPGPVPTTSEKRKITEIAREEYNNTLKELEEIKEVATYNKSERRKDLDGIGIVEIHGDYYYPKIKDLDYVNQRRKELISKVELDRDIDESYFILMGDFFWREVEKNEDELIFSPKKYLEEFSSWFSNLIANEAFRREQVNVFAVPGDHCYVNKRTSPYKYNWDNIFYKVIDLTLKDLENVYIQHRTNSVVEEIKGWRVLLNHQIFSQSKTKAGASSFGKEITTENVDVIMTSNDWSPDYKEKKRMDALKFRIEELDQVPIIWNSSPAADKVAKTRPSIPLLSWNRKYGPDHGQYQIYLD